MPRRTPALLMATLVVFLGALAAQQPEITSMSFRREYLEKFPWTLSNTTAGDAMMLRILVESSGAKNGVEVGTNTGYGAINMGIGFERTGGKLTTIEIDPRTVTEEYVTQLAEAGVTRASLGVQDFDARVQIAVNRVQSYELTASRVNKARELGFGSVNMDLMYGLPRQNLERMTDTLRKTIELRPDRIVEVLRETGTPATFLTKQVRVDRVNQVIREKLSGIRVIRAFVRTDYEERRFDEANASLTDTQLKVTRMFAVMMPLLMGIFNFSTVAIIWFGAYRVDSGEMPIGNLTAFLAYIMQILMSVMMAVLMFVMIPRAAARISLEKIRRVLDFSRMPSRLSIEV